MSQQKQELQFNQITMDQTLPLRQRVLWPNMPLSSLALPDDAEGLHLGAFIPHEDEPVAVISLFIESLPSIDNALPPEGDQGDAWADRRRPKETEKMIRFRKFACARDYQGKGIGTQLLKYATSVARTELRGTMLWCDARKTAQGWYERRGMTTLGDSFYKSSVEYVRMKIDLDSCAWVDPGKGSGGS